MLENRQIHSRANGCACNIASSSVKNDNGGIREGAADDEEVEHGAQPPLSGLSPVSLAFEMETASLWLLLDKVCVCTDCPLVTLQIRFSMNTES